jgi:ornithine cyclodeaminase
LVGIEVLSLYDTDPAATAKLVANLAGQGLRLEVCESTAEAVRGADILTTATADKTRAAILTPGMIEPGMHLNAVGGDCPGKTELHRGVLEMSSVFVEFEPQSRIEGEIQQMPADFAVTEFWQVLAGQRPGRRSCSEVTVFDSVGFALEDYSALRYVHELALERGIGEDVALVPPGTNPKDLFGQIAVHSAQASAARDTLASVLDTLRATQPA